MRRIAVTVLVLALLVATTAAFALTEALKLERSPVTRPRFDRVFSPTCRCPQRTARLALRTRRSDTIDAVMVNADGASVRALASGSRRNAGRIVFRWDGTNDDGALVDDGPYRLRIHFADAHRTILIPNVVRVDTHPPAVEIADIAPRRISPDGDGRRDAARIVFRLSERAQPLLRADGALVLRWKTRAAGAAAIVWRGTASGRPLPAGFYRVTLQSRDLAGNLSATTEAITVRIRYIELALRRPRARSGGLLRFRVLTDARRFRWALLRRASMAHPLASGTARAGAVAVRLPARIGAGRYRLRVTANDHSDGATIVVRTRR